MSLAPGNLTRDEARDRAALIRTASYRVSLDLTTGEQLFRSTTALRFPSAEVGASTFLDLTAPSVAEVTLNGTPLDLSDAFDGNRVRLDNLAADNEVTVVADCAYMHTGVGLHRFTDPVDKQVYLYTHFETYDAHRVYACFDQPDIKAPVTLEVLAPADWRVVSNGAITEAPDLAVGGWWRFATTPAVSPYVTAVVAGPYYEVRSTHRGIDLGLYCRASMAEHLDPDELFLITRQGFDWFEEAFRYPYPFGPKYDQCFVPEFNAGAMENAACITFLEDYVFRSKVTDASYERRAETLLHEMAHMWFGDLVTMRWWDDLWLNESFATYASVLCQGLVTRWPNAWTTFCNTEKTWAYRQDQMPSTHPIAADMVDIRAVEQNFDGITYAKGASVLKQLVAWVGQEHFLAGLQTYFRQHEWGNTELSDLLAVLEQASGRDLSTWSKEWLETAGVNTLRAEFATDGDAAYTSFAVLQEATAEFPTLRPHRLGIGLYDFQGDRLVRRERIELDVVGARTEVPALVGARQPALLLVNDDDLAYAKIRLDPRSLETVIDHLGALDESLARALCWAATWDMCRDAELAARDYVALVLRNIGSEAEIGVVQGLIGQCTAATFHFGALDNRGPLLHLLASAAREHLFAAAAASDHQLAWARAYATAARDQAHVAEIAGLLDGNTVVDGLAIDDELRWTLIRALAAVGAVGDEVIAGEAERDPTAAGQRHAAAARAAVPDAASKKAAWDAIVDDADLPKAVQAAMIGGFQQPDQIDLLLPYRDRYFEIVAPIWRSRTPEVATDIITGLYPAHLIEPETLDASDAYVREASPEPAVRRMLAEARDSVARALRARSVDGAAAR